MRTTKNGAKNGEEKGSRGLARAARNAAIAVAEAGASSVKVREIMTRDVVTVPPDTTVETIIQLMLDRQISGVPVVDDTGAPVGLVSKTDVIRDHYEHGDVDEEEAPKVVGRRGVAFTPGLGFHVHHEPGRLAKEVMTPVAVTIPENASVLVAARMMAGGGIHRMPVVNETGKVVGIVSALDVLGWLAGLAG